MVMMNGILMPRNEAEEYHIAQNNNSAFIAHDPYAVA